MVENALQTAPGEIIYRIMRLGQVMLVYRRRVELLEQGFDSFIHRSLRGLMTRTASFATKPVPHGELKDAKLMKLVSRQVVGSTASFGELD